MRVCLELSDVATPRRRDKSGMSPDRVRAMEPLIMWKEGNESVADAGVADVGDGNSWLLSSSSEKERLVSLSKKK